MVRATDASSQRGLHPLRVTAIALVLAGAVGLLYGSATRAESAGPARAGALAPAADQRDHRNLPTLAGMAALVAATLIFVTLAQRRRPGA